jgi:hypothetical protein
MFDIGRTGPIVAFDVAPDLVFRALASFGWGEVMPTGQSMRLALPLVALATLAGCIRLAVTRNDYSPSTYRHHTVSAYWCAPVGECGNAHSCLR